MSTAITQSAKAHRSACLCFALALLTMATTAWFIVEGINATEPDSPARWAKVASGVLLLVLEAAVFGLAGQWPEHSKVLRALGWAVLVLEITLMSVSQISIGLTAAKSSSGGDTTISALENKSAGARENAKRLQARADELRATGKTANIRLAASEEKAAIKQTAIADEAETDAQKRRGNSTGTPVVEIVGKTGLIALSIALSVALSLSGIVLMHVAGSLWRRASGALPVDVQILELLQRIHGAPAAMPVAMQVEDAASAPALAAPVVPAPALPSGTPGGLPTSINYDYTPAGTVKVTDASTGLTYFSKIKLAGLAGLAGAGALTAPITHAAPAVPASAGASAQSHSGASEQSHSGASEQSHSTEAEKQQTGASGAAEMPGQSETEQAHPGATEQAHPASPSAGKTDAPKRAWTATAVPDGDKLDSAVSGKGATRYNRVRAAVRSGKLKPSMRAIQLAEGGGGIVVRRYLQQLEAEGVIVRAGRGYALAGKAGAQ